jgi:hypothetical protein
MHDMARPGVGFSRHLDILLTKGLVSDQVFHNRCIRVMGHVKFSILDLGRN